MHCPCPICKNKAVSRTTEIKHRKDACDLQRQYEQHIQSEQANNVEKSYFPPVVPDEVDHTSDESDSKSSNTINPNELESEHSHRENIRQRIITATDDEYPNLEAGEPMNFPDPNEDFIGHEKVYDLKSLTVETILDATRLVEKHGCLATVFQDILLLARNIITNKVTNTVDEDSLNLLWPANWEQAQKILRECGYVDAKQYFVCYCYHEKQTKRNDKVHLRRIYNGNWDLMEGKNQLCKNCNRKGEITFYYLGLNAKVINWFKKKDMCKKMLAHWCERNHWLNRDTAFPVKKELWDGQRWCDLQWFWDPKTEWMLPTTCPNCKKVIPVEHIKNSEVQEDNGSMRVECDNCMEEFLHIPKFAKSSPLNIALVAHWDGWQSVSSNQRGSGSIEVSIANMLKKDRNQVEEVYVVEFIPAYQLPRGCPQMLDAFLKPLMDELIYAFFEGFEVEYPLKTIPEYCLKDCETIRLLLLLWSGDHPGQCEIAKLLNQGKCPCRRCKLLGQHLEDPRNTHFYYGDNRKRGRYPWELRLLDNEIFNLLDIEMEKRPSVRKRMSSSKGFTGMSLLHKYLFPLYGFNILRDMVYDIFHTLPLNVVKNQLTYLLDNEIIHPEELDEALRNFPWTRELKAGRLPTPIGNDLKGLSNWKAESFQKFCISFC